jgi:hypothetical protein
VPTSILPSCKQHSGWCWGAGVLRESSCIIPTNCTHNGERSASWVRGGCDVPPEVDDAVHRTRDTCEAITGRVTSSTPCLSHQTCDLSANLLDGCEGLMVQTHYPCPLLCSPRHPCHPCETADVVPLAHALIAANPERIVWVTDWPHPNAASP